MPARSGGSLRSGRLSAVTPRGMCEKNHPADRHPLLGAVVPEAHEWLALQERVAVKILVHQRERPATRRSRDLRRMQALSSISSGATTAPIRQMPSQSKSFSKFSWPSSNTRLPFATPLSLSAAAMSVTAGSRCAETDAIFSWSTSTIASLSGCGSRYSASRSARANRGFPADGRRTHPSRRLLRVPAHGACCLQHCRHDTRISGAPAQMTA